MGITNQTVSIGAIGKNYYSHIENSKDTVVKRRKSKQDLKDDVAVIITMVLTIISVCSLFTISVLVAILMKASMIASIIGCGITMIILGLIGWFCVEYVTYRITKFRR